MSTQVKVWGLTKCLLQNPFVQVHRISVKKGGYCSIHKHDSRSNMFFVIAGSLRVTRHDTDGAPMFSRVVEPGEDYVVAPGEFHSFEAMSSVEALEVYWPQEVLHEDIVRLSEGGLKTGLDSE